MPSQPESKKATARSLLRHIRLVRSQPLAHFIQKEIERQIVAGVLNGGDRLNEFEIARRLGVSRAPVRECLRQMEGAGLVSIRKNYGVFVRIVSIEEARDIYQLRSHIDAGVGQELARRITREQLAELRKRVARLELELAAGDAAAYHEGNVDFHERMVEMTGNLKTLDIYRKLLRELALYRRQSLSQPGAMEASAEEHRHILAAFESGDGDAAGRIMRDHIVASGERMRRAQESSGPAASLTARRGAR